jgi:putative transposase
MSGTTWRRKTNRLPPDRYVGNGAYFLTLATVGRSKRFADPDLVHSCIDRLFRAADVEKFEVLSYVFMPDHLHLLVQGSDTAKLPTFDKRFKQQTAFEFKRATGFDLWQKNYYDRVVRQDEDLNDVARCIAANPVRAGLTSDWRLYPYRGGQLLERALVGDLKVAATSSEMAPP